MGFYRIGRAAWTWWHSSHSDVLGHDHHCPCSQNSNWSQLPQPSCLCGWANFRQALLELEATL